MALLLVNVAKTTFASLRPLLESREICHFTNEGTSPGTTEAAGVHLSGILLGSDGSDYSLLTLSRLRDQLAEVPIAVVAQNGSEDFAARCFRGGATEYVRDPLDESGLRHLSEWLASTCHREPAQEKMIGSSPAMREVKDYIRRLAASECNVLITGESGTGKEIAAEEIHRRSNRAARRLVCLNCPAIPDTLFESEVFGYEKGAFTGAMVRTPGQLEGASGGTVFLDEVAELTPAAQAKLLRVIERKCVVRIGGRTDIPVDVRVIAATNCDLESMAQQGEFRRDLYFRLNVARLHLPPLRERQGDLLELIEHCLGELNGQYRSKVAGVEPDTLEALLSYDWPGNVRELKNCLERLFVSRTGDRLSFRDLPPWALTLKEVRFEGTATESGRMLAALEETQWNKRKAAERLSWSRSTLYRKMSKYQFNAPRQSNGAA